MYLICCPSTQSDSLAELLSANQLIGMPIVLMDFTVDNLQVAWLEEHINDYDYVILVSPTIIEFNKRAIQLATKPTFLTVGVASALKLKELTKQEVLYPEDGSGGMALFTEKMQQLNLVKSRVLIVKGDSGNDSIQKQLELRMVNWQSIAVYKRVEVKLERDYLKKVLISGPWQGIIITSTILVTWLFEQADADDCSNLLKMQTFITIHPQISEALRKLGVEKVSTTKSSEKKSIIELIRNFNE